MELTLFLPAPQTHRPPPLSARDLFTVQRTPGVPPARRRHDDASRAGPRARGVRRPRFHLRRAPAEVQVPGRIARSRRSHDLISSRPAPAPAPRARMQRLAWCLLLICPPPRPAPHMRARRGGLARPGWPVGRAPARRRCRPLREGAMIARRRG
jgi:hypothetical protein